MIAYKFLALGAVGRFSGFVWPRPDTRHYQWVTTDRVELCNSGIHACRLQDLPFWLDDELWLIELDGDVVQEDGVVVANRARLLEHVSAWSHDAAREFARSCSLRARELATQATRDASPRAHAIDTIAATCEIHANASPAEPAYMSWVAFTGYGLRMIGDLREGDGGAGEGRVQADWLAQRVELSRL